MDDTRVAQADIGQLARKVALVTGASSGIGRAIAVAYAAAGAFVVIADLHSTPPDPPVTSQAAAGINPTISTAELINKKDDANHQGGPAPASFIKCDVSQAEDVESAVAFAVATYGRLDIMVNNAGVSAEDQASTDPDGPFRIHEQDPAVLDRDWAINGRGCWLGCKFAIAQMMAQEPHSLSGDRGWIINMSSILGTVALPGYTCYSASKAAIAMMTKAIAVEYGRDRIHVNCIHPGSIDTPILDALKAAKGLEEFNKMFLVKYPWSRLGVPDDVAKAAVFLAGDGASWITGQSLFVDGGYTAM